MPALASPLIWVSDKRNLKEKHLRRRNVSRGIRLILEQDIMVNMHERHESNCTQEQASAFTCHFPKPSTQAAKTATEWQEFYLNAEGRLMLLRTNWGTFFKLAHLKDVLLLPLASSEK